MNQHKSSAATQVFWFSVALAVYVLCPVFLFAQGSFSNPFFNQTNFFFSDYEKNLFADVENNKQPAALPLFLTFSAEEASNKEKKIGKSLEDFYRLLDKKPHSNDIGFLKKVFTQVHKVYLKKYQRYATFDRLSEDGSYDCLTGTALYAMVLDHYGFSYRIHETAVHSYLVVQTSNGKVLFESTDPLEGFIADESAIAELEEKYSRDVSPDFKTIYGLSGPKESTKTLRFFNEEISLIQLSGLHYFNQGAIAFNVKNYRNAATLLEKAYSIYPCKRILHLLLLSVQKVVSTEELTRKESRIYSGMTSYYTKQSGKYFD